MTYGIAGLVLSAFAEHPSRANLFGTDIQISSLTFESDRLSITVQQFLPNGSGRYPTIIALHGSGGIHEGWAEPPARLMASQGYSVFVVHYFERTGTVFAYRYKNDVKAFVGRAVLIRHRSRPHYVQPHTRDKC